MTTRRYSIFANLRPLGLLTLLVFPVGAQTTSTQFASLARLDWPTDASQSSNIDAADIDLDGDMDLVVSRFGSTSPLRLLMNDGRGNLSDVSATNLPTLAVSAAWRVRFARLDRDPWPDLVIVGGGQTQVLLNTRIGGKFTDVTATNVPMHSYTHYGLDVGDVDGDGDIDLVLAANSTTNHEVFLNDGLGKFTRATAPTVPMANLWGATLVDVDGDKDLDCFFANSGAGGQVLVINDGKGLFKDESALRLPTVGGACREIIALDVDRDGDLDAWCAMYNGQDVLFINNGLGTFKDETAARVPMLATGSYGGCAYDVDEDGDTDVVICSWSGSSTELVRLYLNDGRGTFSTATTRMPSTSLNALDAVPVDIDSDNDLDLAYAHWGAQDGAYYNLQGQIHAVNAPTVGQTWNFDVYAQPGFATSPQVGTIFLGVGELKPRWSTPWGRLGILPPLFDGPGFLIPPPGGKTTIPISVPNQASLRGVQLWWQGLHVHAPIDVRLTNVWFETIQ